jgi:succinoglycan biosynthesis protein ExoM
VAGVDSADTVCLRRTETQIAQGISLAPALRTHVSVCVCTFKRPEMLRTLLSALLQQETGDELTYSVIVVDNDAQESGRHTVDLLQRDYPDALKYFVEPEQSIALARNRTIANASGDLVAFIDDDEIPGKDWLLRMYNALVKFNADGVLGPVRPRFTAAPPKWILEAGLFDRPNSREYETGLVLHWSQTGTGNALVRRCVFEEIEGPFRKQFGSGGEDTDFFRRAMMLGRRFVWCEDAVVHETVPVERTRLRFQLKRALLRGKTSLGAHTGGILGILKSVAACGSYMILLPALFVIKRHLFVKYLIKSCDHLGKLLALCGVEVVKDKYVVK